MDVHSTCSFIHVLYSTVIIPRKSTIILLVCITKCESLILVYKYGYMVTLKYFRFKTTVLCKDNY